MPFLGHPLADEPLFDPPRSCIDAIYIGDFADKEDLNMYYPKEERYQPPAGLKLDNEDGDAIPLRQSVTEVYAHVGRNMEELKKVKGERYGEIVTRADGSQGRDITFGRPVTLPADIGISFNFLWATNGDGQVWIRVRLHAEGERFYENGFWAPRLLRVRDCEARRLVWPRSFGVGDMGVPSPSRGLWTGPNN